MCDSLAFAFVFAIFMDFVELRFSVASKSHH